MFLVEDLMIFTGHIVYTNLLADIEQLTPPLTGQRSACYLHDGVETQSKRRYLTLIVEIRLEILLESFHRLNVTP